MKRPPACMTGVEFVEWTTANEWLKGTYNYASSPCVDCTADWHRQQDLAGTCDGVPSLGKRGRPRIDPELKRRRRAETARRYHLAHPEVNRLAVARYQAKRKAAA